MGIYDNSFGEGAQELIRSIKLIGGIDDIKVNQDVFLSIGDNSLRKKCFLKFKDQVIKKNLFRVFLYSWLWRPLYRLTT